MTPRGGVEARRVAADRYHVEVVVNAQTPRDVAEGYVRRAAQEACTGSGFAGYRIVGTVPNTGVERSAGGQGLTTIAIERRRGGLATEVVCVGPAAPGAVAPN
jgi:hypothetical protein